jgi:DNA-binding Lrp family transcriptional regulator
LDTGQDNGTLRVTIREAAARLGVTEAAIRKRIQRGSLGKELGEDGRVYVYLDPSGDASHPETQVDRDILVEDLREQVHYLRSVLNEERDARRRADTIIAQLTQANAALAQRVPELEAPQWPPEGSESVAGGPERAEPPHPVARDAQESAERPWWRRMFRG